MQLWLPSLCTWECGGSFEGSVGSRLGSCCGFSGATVFGGAGLVRAAQSSCTGHCLQLTRGGPEELVSRQKCSSAERDERRCAGCFPVAELLEPGGQACARAGRCALAYSSDAWGHM